MPAACGSRLSQRANVLLFSANRPSRRSSCSYGGMGGELLLDRRRWQVETARTCP